MDVSCSFVLFFMGFSSIFTYKSSCELTLKRVGFHIVLCVYVQVTLAARSVCRSGRTSRTSMNHVMSTSRTTLLQTSVSLTCTTTGHTCLSPTSTFHFVVYGCRIAFLYYYARRSRVAGVKRSSASVYVCVCLSVCLSAR